jgi:squalene-hopene/tetraprenyl-beta-curcumene cyclase
MTRWPSLLCLLTLSFTGSKIRSEERIDWDKKKAAEYLDSRAKTWFEFDGGFRGEGTTRSSCISCHTGLPYILARAELRKSNSEVEPTPSEAKFLAQTRMRVNSWSELSDPKYSLFYSHSEDKKRQSWGTEAVINALVLGLEDRRTGRKSPSSETEKAVANLWKVQIPEGKQKGSWDWLDFGLQPWESEEGHYFGSALAAVALGQVPGYLGSAKAAPEIQKKIENLKDYLRGQSANQSLFNKIWLLWAATQWPELLTAAEKQKICSEVLSKQQADGGWNLASLGHYSRHDETPEENSSDGYATGLVLHVLQLAGFERFDAKISSGLKWLGKNQSPTGEWLATSLNKKRDPNSHVGKFMSDSATGFAVLGLSH